MCIHSTAAKSMDSASETQKIPFSRVLFNRILLNTIHWIVSAAFGQRQIDGLHSIGVDNIQWIWNKIIFGFQNYSDGCCSLFTIQVHHLFIFAGPGGKSAQRREPKEECRKKSRLSSPIGTSGGTRLLELQGAQLVPPPRELRVCSDLCLRTCFIICQNIILLNKIHSQRPADNRPGWMVRRLASG